MMEKYAVNTHKKRNEIQKSYCVWLKLSNNFVLTLKEHDDIFESEAG